MAVPGSIAGAELVADINPGLGDSDISLMTSVRGVLYFVADDGVHGPQLWKANGGVAQRLTTIPYTSLYGFSNLTNANGTLYFDAYSGSGGDALWKSDGTVGGTVLVKSIDPRSFSAYPGEMKAVDGGVEFYGYDGSMAGLFFSDGTAAGTIELASNVAVDVYGGFTKPFVLADTPSAALNDFNGDGHSDILWQNARGQASVWDMNGNSLIGGGPVTSNPGPVWTAIGTGDFNGDRRSDILWQNASTGQASIWEINGNALSGGGPVSSNPGPSWNAVGTGDFNGDSRSDILWQNKNTGQASVWEMNGNTLEGGGTVAPNPGLAWKAIGTGDFNKDGDSDILWQNTNTGQISIWEMQGNTLIGGGAVTPNPGTAWQAIGSGDFDKSGFADDILLQNKNTGQVSIWEMNGSTLVGGGLVSANPGTSWHAIGSDGGSDILFQNTSGQASIWDMNGNTITGGGPVSPSPGPTFRAVGLT
jgi:ELWxxDGT repeat protein